MIAFTWHVQNSKTTKLNPTKDEAGSEKEKEKKEGVKLYRLRTM